MSETLENVNNPGLDPGVNNGTFVPAPQEIVESDTELQRAQEMLSELPELTDQEINSHECKENENTFDLTLSLGSQVILHPDNCFDGGVLPFGWECSDPSIVLVNPIQSLSEALIMGMKEGEAVVKASTTLGAIPEKVVTWNITVAGGGNNPTPDPIQPEEKPEEEYAQEVTDSIKAGGEVELKLTQEYKPTEVLIPIAGTKLDMNFNGKEATQLTGQDFIDLTKGVSATLKGGTIIEKLPPQDKAEAAIYMSGTTKDTLVLEDMTIKAARCVYVNNAADECIIKSGRYEVLYDSTPAVYVACSTSANDSGKVIIEGGTFGTPGVKNKYLLNLLDKLNKVEGKTARDFIEVRGGTFYNYDPSQSTSENPKANFVAEGYEVKVEESGEDKIYTVSKKN